MMSDSDDDNTPDTPTPTPDNTPRVTLDITLSAVGASVATAIDGTDVSDFATYAELTNQAVNQTVFEQINAVEAFNRGYFGQGVTVAHLGALARNFITQDDEIDDRIVRVLSFLPATSDTPGAITAEDDTSVSSREQSEYDGKSSGDHIANSYGAAIALGGGLGRDSNNGVAVTSNVMGVAPSVSFIHAISEIGIHSRNDGRMGVYRDSVLAATDFMATTTADNHAVHIVNNQWITHADWRFEGGANLATTRWFESMAGVYDGPDADGNNISVTLLVSHLPSLKGLLDTGKSANSSLTALFKTMADGVAGNDRVWVYGADEFTNWHEGATLSACSLSDGNGITAYTRAIGGNMVSTPARVAHCTADPTSADPASNASISIKIADFIAHFDDNVTADALLTMDGTDFSSLFKGYGELSTLGLTVNSPGLWGLAPVYEPDLIGSYVVAVGVDWQVSGGVTTYSLYDDDSYGNYSASAACGIAKNWCLAAPAAIRYSANPLAVPEILSTQKSNAVAASYVAGALALLRSRHPSQPMSVALAILFATATDINMDGTVKDNDDEKDGVDDIFGHGLLNISAAIHLSGEQTIVLSGVIDNSGGGNSGGNSGNDANLLINSGAALSPAMQGLSDGLKNLSVAVGVPGIGLVYNMPIANLLTISAPNDDGSMGEAAQWLFNSSTKEAVVALPFATETNLYIVRDSDDYRPLQINFNHNNLRLSYHLCGACTDTYNVWDKYGFSALTETPHLYKRGIKGGKPYFATDQEYITGAYWFGNNVAFVSGLGLGDNINGDSTYHHYGIRYQNDLNFNHQWANFYAEYGLVKEPNGRAGGADFNGALGLVGNATKQTRLGLVTELMGWLVSADYEYGTGYRQGITGGLIESLYYRYQGGRLGMQKDGVWRSNDRLRFGIEKQTAIDKGRVSVRRGVVDKDGAVIYQTDTALWQNPAVWNYYIGYGILLNENSQIGLGLEHSNGEGTKNTATSLFYRVGF